MPKILLIEDDKTMQDLLKTLLELEQFATEFTNFVKETAIESIRRTNPDAILMDVHLSGDNGIDVIKQLRQLPAHQDTKVLMVSGMDLKSECLEAGADGFLMKPYNPADLIDWMKRNT